MMKIVGVIAICLVLCLVAAFVLFVAFGLWHLRTEPRRRAAICEVLADGQWRRTLEIRRAHPDLATTATYSTLFEMEREGILESRIYDDDVDKAVQRVIYRMRSDVDGA